MKVFLRVLGTIIANGFLTSLLWFIPVYIFFSKHPSSGFPDNMNAVAIIFLIILGFITGGVTGGLIGFLKTSALISAAIGGSVGLTFGCVLLGENFSYPEKQLPLLLVILVSAVLSALACMITALIFNNPATIQLRKI